MINSFKFAVSIIATATIISCGKEEKADMGGQPSTSAPAQEGPSQTSTPMTLVLTAAEMPPCSAENNNQLIYVKDSAKFVTCSNGAWTDITIKGEKGDAGAKGDSGAKGDKGDQGAAGTDNRIISNVYCTGDLENTAFDFVFDANLMESGDVLVSGSIGDAVSERGATVVYSAKQNGAANPAVWIRSDVLATDNYGTWKLELNRQTLVTTVTYFDTEATNGQIVWTMTPDKCLVSNF